MECRPAEPDQTYAVFIDESPAIKFIDGSLKCGHPSRTFACGIGVIAIRSSFARIADLKNHDPLSCQGLCGEGAIPWTIHPESIFFVTVSLDRKRIPVAGLVIRREIQTPDYFMPVRGFPFHGLHGCKLKIAELGI